MDLKALKYFIEIAEQKSMNKAAEALYISQPNLSKAMKNLENELEVPLFIRNNHGVILTNYGESLYVYARDVVNQISTIEYIAKNRTRELVSKLSIAISHLFIRDDLILKYYDLQESNHCIVNLNETTLEDAVKSVNNLINEFAICAVNTYEYSMLKKMIDFNVLKLEEIGVSDLMIHLSSKNEIATKKIISGKDLLHLTRLQLPSCYFDHVTAVYPHAGVSLHDFEKTISVDNYHNFINLLKHKNTFIFGHKWNSLELSKGSISTLPVKKNEFKMYLLIIHRKKEILSEQALSFINLFKEAYSNL